MTTRIPDDAKSLAVAAPRPAEPAVMRTTRGDAIVEFCVVDDLEANEYKDLILVVHAYISTISSGCQNSLRTPFKLAETQQSSCFKG
jgi:hypothetical protein